MEPIEYIIWNGKPLAYIIRAELNPDRTTFLTPHELSLQVGFVAYPAGGEIARHVQLSLERHIVGTPEVLVVRRGRCEADIYNEEQQLVANRELRGSSNSSAFRWSET